MQEFNHSKLLGVMAGQAGDYYIGVEAVTTKKFSMIVIGPDGATVTVCKIRGVDVIADRNYGILPEGYRMVAGGDDYFDAITLSEGNAEGVIYPENMAIELVEVNIADGEAGAAMSIGITFNNTGNSGSKKVFWKVQNDSDDAVVQTGEKVVYFLKGTGVTVNLTGSIYYETAGVDYALYVQIEDTDIWWNAEEGFDITAPE
jgi:hypothetical protein